MSATGRWLLRDALVLRHAGAPAAREDIVIGDGIVLAVGPGLDAADWQVERVVDMSRRLVTPGLINTHYHSHDRWDRGRFSPLPLEIWMSLYNPPSVGRDWTPDEIYLRTLLGAMELVRGGSTCVMDDAHLGLQLDPASIDAVFRANDDLGIRADIGVAYADRPGFESIPYFAEELPDHLKTRGQVAAHEPEAMLDVWAGLMQRWSGRVRAVVSVSGPQRCSDRFQQEAWDLAARFDRPVLTHVLETRIQALTGELFYGCSLVEHMERIGVLRPNSVLIHGVWMSDDDLDRVAQAGAGISHNPASNLKLGSGIAPVIRMRERGIPVGLGTDNHNANDGCAMFEAVKWGTLLQTLREPEYQRWLDAASGLDMATMGGAALMGKAGSLGRLSPGFAADFLVFDLAHDAFLPLNDATRQLVFANAAGALRSAYVAGNPVLEDGRLTRIDEMAIRREIDDRLAHMLGKVEAGIPVGKEWEPHLVTAYRRAMAELSRRHGPACPCCRR